MATTDNAQAARAATVGKGKTVWMAPKLAFRNLIHDRVSLLVTLTGIVFSVVLVAVQFGLYLGSERTIAAVLDQVKADLWIAPIGTKSFDDPNYLMGRERYAVLSTPGVSSAQDLVVFFASWRKPKGGATTVVVVGSDWEEGGLKPWNIVAGSLDDLEAPHGVAVDRSYFKDLGIDGLGAHAEINSQRVVVRAVTDRIRSFTTLPYVFTTLKRARTYDPRAVGDDSSYTLIQLADGADRKEVKAALAKQLPDIEVLDHDQFRKRSIDYWLFQTGAGAALIAGAILGLIVGVVIVAQTLYSSTKDHLNEFATLRALGASASYIRQVILMQAMISALVGYLIGMALSLLVVWAADGTAMVVVMTRELAALLFVITVVMCAIAAISAIFKVTRIDPAGVFSR